MALLVFPCSAAAAGKGYGSASFPAALVKPKAKGKAAGKQEPTLWFYGGKQGLIL
jgi:hypothetical protein